jgi:prolipoprotein diacylglyceryltransferase
MLPTNTDKAIDVVELAVYAILTLPAIYCLIRHGPQGILGWLYLIIYCTIRLVAAGLKLKGDLDHTISSGALIVDNIGLSPLLLGAAGILHEA